jgi:hypothetical protein
MLARQHADDFLRLDSSGKILAAYPFSMIPTPHVVRINTVPEDHFNCSVGNYRHGLKTLQAIGGNRPAHILAPAPVS